MSKVEEIWVFGFCFFLVDLVILSVRMTKTSKALDKIYTEKPGTQTLVIALGSNAYEYSKNHMYKDKHSSCTVLNNS